MPWELFIDGNKHSDIVAQSFHRANDSGISSLDEYVFDLPEGKRLDKAEFNKAVQAGKVEILESEGEGHYKVHTFLQAWKMNATIRITALNG